LVEDNPMDPEIFEKAYDGQAPWDIGGPQPEIVRLAEAGAIRGVVLDVGCGTGENALYLAGRGLDVWGIDFIPKAIERARDKALQRGLGVTSRSATR
jgi:2-polyprenyl-3-methyl-5-hydroxy-6-metoxy-1,4-benzoquinol methylase